MNNLKAVRWWLVVLAIAAPTGVLLFSWSDSGTFAGPWGWKRALSRAFLDGDRLPARGEYVEGVVEEVGGLGRQPGALRRPDAMPGRALRPDGPWEGPPGPAPRASARLPAALRGGRGRVHGQGPSDRKTGRSEGPAVQSSNGQPE